MRTLPSRKNFRIFLCCLGGLFCLIGILAPSAGAQSLCLIRGASRVTTRISISLDPLTGQQLTSVPITAGGEGVSGGFWGLAKNPSTGTYFAIQNRTELVTINPTTGVMTDIGPTGHNVGGITFATGAGNSVTLYMVSGNSDETNPDSLFTLNTSTGAATLVLAFDDGNMGETIAFNPVDGMLYRFYGSGEGDQFLVKVNPTTLAVTNIPLTGDSYNQATTLTHWAGNFFLMADHNTNAFIVTNTGLVKQLTALNSGSGDTKGLVFDSSAPSCSPLAALYATANQSSTTPSLLYTLNSTTAAVTLIGPTGFEGVSGIKFNSAGTLYGVGQTEDGNNTPVLITINPCTGAGTQVGPTMVTSQGFTAVEDIAFSNGTLFGFLTGGDEEVGLAIINPATGAITSVVKTYETEQGGGLANSSENVLLTHI